MCIVLNEMSVAVSVSPNFCFSSFIYSETLCVYPISPYHLDGDLKMGERGGGGGREGNDRVA